MLPQTRGFSFQHDAPLDMRFSPGLGLTAADLVNTWSEADLADLLPNVMGLCACAVVIVTLSVLHFRKTFD